MTDRVTNDRDPAPETHPRMPIGADPALSLEGAAGESRVFTVYDEIKAERRRQDEKWGGPEHDDQHATYDWCGFIDEHNRKAEAATGGNATLILDPDAAERYRHRMIEVAALAVAAIQALDRRIGGDAPSSTTPDVRSETATSDEGATAAPSEAKVDNLIAWLNARANRADLPYPMTAKLFREAATALSESRGLKGALDLSAKRTMEALDRAERAEAALSEARTALRDTIRAHHGVVVPSKLHKPSEQDFTECPALTCRRVAALLSDPPAEPKEASDG